MCTRHREGVVSRTRGALYMSGLGLEVVQLPKGPGLYCIDGISHVEHVHACMCTLAHACVGKSTPSMRGMCVLHVQGEVCTYVYTCNPSPSGRLPAGALNS